MNRRKLSPLFLFLVNLVFCLQAVTGKEGTEDANGNLILFSNPETVRQHLFNNLAKQAQEAFTDEKLIKAGTNGRYKNALEQAAEDEFSGKKTVLPVVGAKAEEILEILAKLSSEKITEPFTRYSAGKSPIYLEASIVYADLDPKVFKNILQKRLLKQANQFHNNTKAANKSAIQDFTDHAVS